MRLSNNTISHRTKVIRLASILVSFVLVELAILLSVYLFVSHSEKNSALETIQRINQDIMAKMTFSFSLIQHNLNRNTAFFRINGIYVPRNNYTDYIQFDSLPIKNSIDSYFWIAKVPQKEVQTFNHFCNESVLEGCFLNELDDPSLGTRKAVSNRSNYWPFVYSEPTLGAVDSVLTGFDFGSSPSTLDLLENMMQNVNQTVSSRVSLVTSPNPDNPYSYGVLINKGAVVNTSFPSSDNVFGYMSAIVKIEEVITDSISQLNLSLEREDLEIFVFDVTDESVYEKNISLLYKENTENYRNIWFINQTEEFVDDYSLVNNYILLNREWNIIFLFQREYINRLKGSFSKIITASLVSIFVCLNLSVLFLGNFFMAKENIRRIQDKIAVGNQMLRYVSHEVRNPLNVIKMILDYTIDEFLEFFGLSKITEITKLTDREYLSINSKDMMAILSNLHTAVNSCDLIEHIVKDLLDLRKLEDGKLELDTRPHFLESILSDIRKTFGPKFEEKGSDVSFNISWDDSIRIINLDKHRLKQILLNYISNSIKYTKRGEISLSIELVDNKIRFSVGDTGRGIKEEYKSKIFSPFAQTDINDVSRHGGNGLGLHLCKMLASRMKGDVGFFSTYGEGSVFWVEFDSSIINNSCSLSLSKDEDVILDEVPSEFSDFSEFTDLDPAEEIDYEKDMRGGVMILVENDK